MAGGGAVGADVEELRALAAQFSSSATRLRHVAQSIRQGIQISAWVGPVAVDFRTLWDTDYSRRLTSVATELESAADVLRRNAAEQERTSRDDGSLLPRTSSARPSGPDPDSKPRPVVNGDLLMFAAASGSEESMLPAGWHEVTDLAELRRLSLEPSDLHDPQSGLDAHVFTDSEGNYVLAFAGSKGNMLAPFGAGNEDWREDLSTTVSGILPVNASEQAQRAADLAYRLKLNVGGDHLQLTGHSLGGRNAAVASVATGCEAVTFNAAGPTDEDLLYAKTLDDGHSPGILEYVGSKFTGGASISGGIPDGQITNYRVVTDPLSAIQAPVRFGPFDVLPDLTRPALGEEHLISSGFDWGKVVDAPDPFAAAQALLLQGHDLDNFDDKIPGQGGSGGW